MNIENYKNCSTCQKPTEESEFSFEEIHKCKGCGIMTLWQKIPDWILEKLEKLEQLEKQIGG